jgi:hypothetical protein
MTRRRRFAKEFEEEAIHIDARTRPSTGWERNRPVCLPANDLSKLSIWEGVFTEFTVVDDLGLGLRVVGRCDRDVGPGGALPEHPSLGEAGEVVERAGDKPLPAWILSFGGGGEQLEKIPGTRCRSGACHGGGSIEKTLQFVLATS